jgi:hypothetical protein
MHELKRGLSIAATLAIALVTLSAHAQNFSTNRSILSTDPVQYLFPEQVTVPAGKSSPVNLHFRIAVGLHINSHTPSDDYLIPTTFSIPEGAGVHLDKAAYPAGADLTLPADPKTKLSVYSGEFVIQARIVSTPGNHLVEAKLRYQACNQTECLPPKTIPVAIDVIGK